MIKPAETLKALDLKGRAIAVIGVDGVSREVADVLEASLVTRLKGLGLTLVERQRIKAVLEELQLQSFGVTDGAKAAELGKLANAEYLLLGHVQTLGSTTMIALRLVATELGTVIGSAEAECRDCRQDDYTQALGFLIDDWIARTQE